jgi:hypothetical protein
MIVLALLSGIWIAEFSGPAAMWQCELYAEVYEAEGVKCVVWLK